MVMRVDQSEDEYAESAEINVTPFIDVMLVLLIIFIIAAPLSTVDIPVDLPVSSADAAPPPQEPVTVSVSKDRTLSIGDSSVAGPNFAATLVETTHGDRDTTIYLRADRRVPYEAVMDAMNRLRAAGYLNVALVGLEGNG